jgi:hypothetical protein
MPDCGKSFLHPMEKTSLNELSNKRYGNAFPMRPIELRRQVWIATNFELPMAFDLAQMQSYLEHHFV